MMFMIAGGGLLLSACSSIIDSHTQKKEMMENYMSGDYAKVHQEVKEQVQFTKGGGDELMWRMEAGSFYFLTDSHPMSLKHFNCAENILIERDNRAEITARGAGNETGAAVTNANALPYEGFSRDRIMIAVYRSLIYLAQKDPDGALVEIRKLRNIQEEVRQKYMKQIEAEKKENIKLQKKSDADFAKVGKKEKSTNAKTPQADIMKGLASDTAYKQHQALSAELGQKGYGNFLNPLAVYLSGIGCLMEKDYNNAAVDFKRLYEVMPTNPLVRKSYVTILKRNGDPVPDSLRGVEPFNHPLHDKMVYIIFANGRGLGFKEFKVQLILPYLGYTGLAFPICETYPAVFERADIQTEKLSLSTVPIADMDAIMAQEYNERLPLMITRLVINYLVKESASLVATQAASEAHGAAGAAAYIGTGLYKYIFNTGDTRSWEMLCKEYQAAQFPIPPGRKFTVTPKCLNRTLSAPSTSFTLKSNTKIAFLYIAAPSEKTLQYKLIELDRLPQ